MPSSEAELPLLVRNLTRDAVLATRAGHARSFWARARGLLGTRGLPRGGGLVLEPCTSVHMLGMRYPIDVAFLDGEDVVIAIRPGLRPWRFTSVVRGARRAIELPVGVLEATGTRPGDRLRLEPIREAT